MARTSDDFERFVKDFPLFGDTPQEWGAWDLKDRIVAAYGMATNGRHELGKMMDGMPDGKERRGVAAAITGLDTMRAAFCQILGMTLTEIEAASTEAWVRLGDPSKPTRN